MYVKLFSSILTSSIWAEDAETRLVWITMLLMARPPEGFVEAAPSGLARAAQVPRDACNRALAILEGPDIESKNQDFAGKRIERVDGGWLVLNYAHYRSVVRRDDMWVHQPGGAGYVYYILRPDGLVKIGYSKNPWARFADLQVAIPKAVLLATERGTQQLERARHQQFKDGRVEGEWFKRIPELDAHITAHSKNARHPLAEINPVAATVVSRRYSSGLEVEVEVEGKKGITPPPQPRRPGRPRTDEIVSQVFVEAWAVYPRRAGSNPKSTAWKCWHARTVEGEAPAAILDGVKRYAAFCRATGKTGTEYVMQAARFFGHSKEYAEPWTAPPKEQKYGREDARQRAPEPLRETPDPRAKLMRLGDIMREQGIDTHYDNRTPPQGATP